MHKGIIFGIVGVVIVGFLVWGYMDLQNKEMVSEEMTKGIVYFYGEECPHCKDVEAFLEENNVDEKVEYIKKEVWYDASNNREMLVRAEECGIDVNRVGVPFLYARGECFIGAPQVEQFFTEEMEKSLE